MTAIDLPALMRDHEQLVAVAADPDLSREAKAFVCCTIARRHHRRTSPPGGRPSARGGWFAEVNAMAGDGDPNQWWIRNVLRDDIPRYEAAGDRRGCAAQMIRRAGLCGRRTCTAFVDRDPATGEGRWVGYCRRHWTTARETEHHARLAAWEASGKPCPPPNTGGLLRRYINADWAALYAWAEPTPPQFGSRAAASPGPRPLRLIRGGGA